MKNDSDTTVQELKDMILKFSAERGWMEHHTPRSLAISISLEAAELLEHFQWEDIKANTKEQMADEVADILSYLLAFADATDIDVATAYRAKLAKSAIKYPAEIFNEGSLGREEYLAIKQAHRKAKGKQ